MRNGDASVASSLFGAPGQVEVERGLAEFRGGRPVRITASGDSIVALPVDGLGTRRLAAFKAFAAPALPRLVISARRARALGLEGSEPVAIPLSGSEDIETIEALVTDVKARPRSAEPAGAAAKAAIELAKFAQRLPALLMAVVDPGSAVVSPPLVAIDSDAIGRFRRSVLQSLTIASEAQVPLHGVHAARFVVFRDAIGGSSVAVVVGKPDFSKPVPVRLHSACLTGDVFGSRRCDCGDQLKLALARLDEAGGGVILYLEQEGRGVGLVNKMRAYQLQDDGLDTVDANTTLGFDDDERDYGVAARMLEMLGCTRVRLLTNNPAKLHSLTTAGIEVIGRLPLYTPINADNRRYLTAKLKRAGHRLDHLVAALSEPGQAENDRP
ncbi:MAG: GTP cyclohydrolase II RibA [Hyphomicrobiales bacterium]|nr:GTP cyclohydrolase II RibA [Hyphomicrobiales bacterium]MBV8826842.1 GTP cyclohydrolase II RibA [Hyphomicrobiales bacterium]